MTPIAELDRPPQSEELAIIERESSGPLALALLSEKDFNARLESLRVAQDRVRRIQRELMVEGEDYGIIPGTKKPTLLKPGAEKLCLVYRFVPTFEEHVTIGDGETTPDLRVRVKCHLHRFHSEGEIGGEGGGAANSWERRYRYRSGQRACPSCGVEGALRRSKFEDRQGDKGWYCHDKAGGCGAQFKSNDPKIAEQQAGQVDNPDPFDQENTLLKMGLKRAMIDAVLRATGTSGLFAQDLEDLSGGHREPAPPPIQPAQRLGNGNGGNGHAAAPDAPAADPSIGKVKAVTEHQDGTQKPFWAVTLTTGFVCLTRNADLAQAARDASRDSRLIECRTKAPSDPAKFKPTLLELAVR